MNLLLYLPTVIYEHILNRRMALIITIDNRMYNKSANVYYSKKRKL